MLTSLFTFCSFAYDYAHRRKLARCTLELNSGPSKTIFFLFFYFFFFYLHCITLHVTLNSQVVTYITIVLTIDHTEP